MNSAAQRSTVPLFKLNIIASEATGCLSEACQLLEHLPDRLLNMKEMIKVPKYFDNTSNVCVCVCELEKANVLITLPTPLPLMRRKKPRAEVTELKYSWLSY